MVRRKDAPPYRSANQRFRWMLVRLRRPLWAGMGVGVAAAAVAAKANLPRIQRRGYFFVAALARTWCLANGRALKDLVTHWPNKHSRRCWVPLEAPGRRRTSWADTKRARLRHRGEVTLILSKPRRNQGPKHTKILVTNLPDVTARQGGDISRRRWSVELLMKELTGAMGLGRPPVTDAPQRVERSGAISRMASLTRLKFRSDIGYALPGRQWLGKKDGASAVKVKGAHFAEQIILTCVRWYVALLSII
jgi:hypothetical protein